MGSFAAMVLQIGAQLKGEGKKVQDVGDRNGVCLSTETKRMADILKSEDRVGRQNKVYRPLGPVDGVIDSVSSPCLSHFFEALNPNDR